MSVRMTALRGYVRWRYRARHDLDRMMRELPSRQQPAEVPDDVAADCAITRSVMGGRPVVTMSSRSEPATAHVVHLHGGAYVYAVQELHWRALARLVQQSGATFHVPSYGLAPEKTVDDAYPLIDAVVAHAREASGALPLHLSGDSAGGGLALGQAIRMRDGGQRPVDRLFLFSPWVDLTLSHPSVPRLQRADPMLSRTMLVHSGRLWAGEHSPSSPVVSPLRAQLDGLPPVHSYIGGRDLLLADARELDRKIRATGGESLLRVYPAGFHVFMAALTTPESQQVIADVALRLRGRAAEASDDGARAE